MDKLDVQTIQQLFTTKGAWRSDCYSTIIIDLKEAIRDNRDPPLCNDLICMASRLADKNERVEVRGFIRKMTDLSLLRSHPEHFLTNTANMDRTKRSAIFKRIGQLFFQKYMTGTERNPYCIIKAIVTKCTPGLATIPKKKKIIKDEEAKESSDDVNSSSSDSDNSDNDNSNSSSAIITPPVIKNDVSPEQRNIMVCLLMRFVNNSAARGMAIGKIITAMAIEGVIDPQTIEYVIHINSQLLTKKVMGQLIKIAPKLPTPSFMVAVMYGFETERGGRLETLMALSKRDDLPDKGSIIIGKLLARTGMLVEDKRRAFTQIEIRALLSGIEADSRKVKVQEAHKIEMFELSKLSMVSNTPPEVSDNDTDNDEK